ncbi:MAG: transposase [Chloroflexota bacterium]
MPDYDPRIHHRRSIRAKEYDYSQPGAYFVTLCVNDRRCLFGRVVDEAMEMNPAGRTIERWWLELPNKFTHVTPDTHVIMPNHLHGIIVLRDYGTPPHGNQGAHAGAPLPAIVQWFKTMTTNDYIHGVRELAWPAFHVRLWQRNYCEHVIRDEAELCRAREYVVSNPLRWALDRENPELSASPGRPGVGG